MVNEVIGIVSVDISSRPLAYMPARETHEPHRTSSRRILTVPPELGHGVLLRKSGLVICRRLSATSWEIIGRQLITAADSSSWWIGDWLAYGETTFMDRYREAIRDTCLKYQTLRNYVWVARRFELPRRRDSLSFGHHAELAALEQPEQEYWLRKAVEFGWSRNELRRCLRASQRERRGGPSMPGRSASAQEPANRADLNGAEPDALGTYTPDSGDGDSGRSALGLRLPITSRQRMAFLAAARAENVGLAEWAIRVLCAASNCDGEQKLCQAG